MKNIILILITIFLTSCSKEFKNTFYKSDLEQFNLKGKVKTLESEYFDVIIEYDSIKKGNKIESNFNDGNFNVKFDNNGLLYNRINFIQNGQIESEFKLYKDKSGKIVKFERINYNKNQTVIDLEETSFLYNKIDSVKEVLIKNGDYKRKIKFEFNKQNQKIKRTDFVNDTLLEYIIFEYDSFDNLITKNIFSHDSKKKTLISKIYNSENNILLEKVYVDDLFQIRDFENHYSYNSKGNLIETKIDYYNDSSYTKYSYKYYDNNIIKESKRKIVNPFHENDIQLESYDNFSNLKTRTILYPNEKVKYEWKYEYTYDNQNNWIKKISYANGKPFNITERIIEYY